MHDESVLVDWSSLPGLHSALDRIKLTKRDEENFWDADYKVYAEKFKLCAEYVEVSRLVPRPYSVRHGGASHDASEKRRQLLDIQRRGGWKHLDNLLRYEKRGRIQKSMDRLGGDTLAWCASSRRQLGRLVLGDSSRLPARFPEALRR